MNDNPLFDARAVANLLLDVGDECGVAITNLVLQKLLYFMHGIHLVHHRQALVDGYFEAWTFGPVHPAVYRSFKSAGNGAITVRAVRRDFRTGVVAPIPAIRDHDIVALAQRVADGLGRWPSSRLVALSHAPGAPWHAVVNEDGTARGTRISDRVIVERFYRHKLAVDADSPGEEPDQEAPLARRGSR